MKLIRFIAALVINVIAGVQFAAALSPEQELAELRMRIEALEQQNEVLMRSVNDEAVEKIGPSMSVDGSDEIAPVLEDKPSDEWPEAAWMGDDECLPGCNGSGDNSDDFAMTASWNHGLVVATKDKDFSLHIGGLVQFDAGWFDAPENVQDNINEPYENGVDFRRGRIRFDGTMYSTIDWVMEYDFFNSFDADGTTHTVTGPTSLYWTFREVPVVGNVRIGNQKPAIGMEHLTSARFLPFMERSFNQDSFYGGRFNGYLPGISCFDNWGADDMGTWNVGVYKPVDNVFAFNANDGDFATAGRLTGLLWYAGDGCSLFHVGGSVMHATTVDDQIVFRTRDAIRTGLSVDWPVPASTGTIAGDDMQWFNGELAAVQGPFTFQSEYLVSTLDDAALIVANVVQPSVGDAVYHGGYMQVMYFLTGEHDNYNKATGVFERVIPHSNFYFRPGCGAAGRGAWQIGARYNFLDLNDNTIDGGILNNLTCGLNWFLNPNMKVQFDYMMTDRDAALAGDLGDGIIHGWGTRFSLDF